jgi:hypothetical protein
MKEQLSPEIKEVMNALHYRPAVSVILPFETKVGLMAEVQKELKYALDKTERQLREQYPAEMVATVMHKINDLTAEIKIPAGKKGLAIFASPVFSKLMFLEEKVPARIVIDDSFEVRDLVFSKKQKQQYLLFLLSSERCKLFMGDGRELIPVKLPSPDSIDAYWNDETERVANFTDPDEYKTTQVEKFIRQMDKDLLQILNSHRLPVFVMGSKTILGLYKTITHAGIHISGFVDGNFEEASVPQLLTALTPVYNSWKLKQQQQLLEQIEQAANEKKLCCGIQDVWEEASAKKGRILVVEKNFVAAGEHVAEGKIVYKPTSGQNDFHTSNDVVDDVIELVLQNGGDVAFTDDGLLSKFDHIALIKYYA